MTTKQEAEQAQQMMLRTVAIANTHRYRIVETDNYGRDYPDEKFLNIPDVSEKHAWAIAHAINTATPKDGARFWKVVRADYQLQPGFEP